MKSVALSFVLFLLAAVLVVPEVSSVALDPTILQFIPMAMMAVAIMLQLDTVLLLRSRVDSAKIGAESKRLADENSDLNQRLHEVKRQQTELKSKLVAQEKELRANTAEHGQYQADVEALRTALSDAQSKLAVAESNVKHSEGTSAIELLRLLQEEGRLIDFLMDDISQYPDQQVGAASRVVHEGCRKILGDSFSVRPLRQESEGSAVEIGPDDGARTYRLIGQVRGDAPFSGRMVHRGWVADKVSLPQTIHAESGSKVLAPAQVELS